jgi:hypothetical protein
MNTKSMETKGSVTVIDKFTGEVRTGGADLINEMFGNLAQEREMFLASNNPCYLFGRVRQNEGAFGAGEIKQMLDATFECACRRSPDAWYPNQYALGLADAIREAAGIDVGFFLSNFELGLRISGERAARHFGQGDWLKESTQLAARLNHPDALDQLTDADYRDIVAHVAGHPRYAAAMAWYEKESGNQMRGKESAGAGERSPTEEAAHEFLMAAGMVVLEVSRDQVVHMDLSGPLRKLRGLMSNAATVAARKGKLTLVFSGWESDPRELYEIDEVRNYFAALDREFPYWLWFLMQDEITLSVLLLCPPCKVESDGRTAWSRIDAPVLKIWYLRHTDALIELAEKHGLDDAEVAEVFKSFTEIMVPYAKQA